METEASQIDVQGTRHRMARDRAQALHHVMIDLRTALSNARTALEAYGLSPHAKSQLTNFSDHIKQIYGVVRILELDGIGLLAEEIIAAAQVPAEKQDGFVAEEYEVLVRATLSLETYIEQTEHGEAAAPLVLLPLLNDLRAVQQAPMLSEMALFAPNLDNLPPMSVSGNHSAKTMARRLRPYYQSGLLRWYNDPGDDRGLLQLTTIIHRMERASRNSHAHQVWWIARGLIDAVLNHAIELSVAVRVLFGKLDRVLKSIRDQGEDVLDLNPPRDVVKNMLYYIAKSPAVSIRVQDIKKQYALDHLLPDTEQIRRALGDLGGPMQGLPETIAAALKEELARVKVLLDSYTYGERQDPAMLTDAADILKSTADTLTLLGVYDAQKALAAGGKLLRDSVAREETLSESQMLLFAEQLLRVEAVLNNLREHLLAQPEFALSGSEDDSVEGVSAMTLPNYRSTPGAEFKKIRNLALKQCIGNFKAIKQQILSYVGDPKLHHAPSGVPTLLYEIGGCLEIMELSDAARIAGRLAQHIELRVLEVEGVPNEEFLDVLAEAIMSFELYLDTLIDEHGDPVSALQMVRDTEAVINKTASFKPTVVPSPVTKDTTMEATQNLAVTSASAQEKVTNIENLMTTLEEPVEAIDDEVIGIFFEEADEQIAVIKDTLLALRDGKPVAGLLQLMQRICHTLRGSARIVQAAQVAEVAEHVERLCGALEEGKVALNDQTTAVLSTVPTVLGVTLDAYKQSIPMPDIAGEFQLQVNRLLHAQSRGTDAVAQPLLPKTDLNSGHAADLLSSFIVEANASLDNIRRYIDECMSAPAGCRVSDGLIHTVKSITTNAATLDFAELAHISSLLENYLGKIKDANISADVQAFRILTDFCSTVNVLLLGLRSPFPRPVDT
ncbi:MAG: Hpt domain-containing protein, partial [Gammaproteobacteria bacterium]|nr:Hpt domain-containing protein [Gammaproteobacteria bacterium]